LYKPTCIVTSHASSGVRQTLKNSCSNRTSRNSTKKQK